MTTKEHDETDHATDASTDPAPPRGELWQTEAWWAALRAAITPQVSARAIAYARALVRRTRADAWCDLTPRELAATALSDTAAGVVHWDPSVPLSRFLAMRIKRILAAARREEGRQVRIDHVRGHDADDAPDGGRAPDAAATLELQLAADAHVPQQLATHEAAVALLAWLDDVTVDDPDARAYLLARQAGHNGLPAIATATGRTVTAVQAAQMRVRRLARRCPPAMLEHLSAALA